MKQHHTRNKGRPQGAPSHKRAAMRREAVATVAERHPNRRRKQDAAETTAPKARSAPAAQAQGQQRVKPLVMAERHRWNGRALRLMPNGSAPALASVIPVWAMGCDLHDGELSQVNIDGADVPVMARASADVDGLDLIEVLALLDRDAGHVVAVVDAASGLGIAGVVATCAPPIEGRYVDLGLFATLALARYTTRALERLALNIGGPGRTLAAVYMEAAK